MTCAQRESLKASTDFAVGSKPVYVGSKKYSSLLSAQFEVLKSASLHGRLGDLKTRYDAQGRPEDLEHPTLCSNDFGKSCS